MPHVFPFFVTPRLEAFRFLQTRFGFDTPEIEQIGRECFIRYRKGDRWVSIACEPGSVPIVELFHSTPEIKDRRIPRLKSGLANRRHLADTDEAQQREILQAQAADLETVEREFLLAT